MKKTLFTKEIMPDKPEVKENTDIEKNLILKTDEVLRDESSPIISSIQFGDKVDFSKNKKPIRLDDKVKVSNEQNIDAISPPSNFFFDMGDVQLKNNFTIYFNAPVYSCTVDMAISLIESVNRAILFNEFTYPELKGLITPKFIINSGGGDVIQGLRLFDAIKNNIYPFTTIASGMAASMGIILLVAGAKVKAAPHTVLLIHPLSAGMDGDFYKLEGYMKLYTDLQTKLTDILIENTNAKREDVIDFMSGESFIMAKEALDLGIIDEIVPTI